MTRKVRKPNHKTTNFNIACSVSVTPLLSKFNSPCSGEVSKSMKIELLNSLGIRKNNIKNERNFNFIK